MEWAHIYNHLYMYIDVLAWPTSFHKKRRSIHDIMLITSDTGKNNMYTFPAVDIFNQNCQIFAFKSFDHICLAKWKRLKSSPLGVFQIGKAYKSKIQQRFVEKTRQPVREFWMIEGFKIIGALPYRLYWMVGCALESRWHRQFSLMLPTTMQS